MNQSDTRYELGYRVFERACASKPKISDAIDFMVQNATDADWGCIERSLKIMESGVQKRSPEWDKFMKWMMDLANQEWRKDMIYYSICYDGFRL